ncbi:hypothetical protein HPB48_000730 [Haemaphysalis longicornis]|uniref:Uncharacterized protein n=1 Tax=Haemaphysalis longicornis TaxID=44386 RepID=A0A9J6GZ87_HAELO|nr:hypothetical protein HPB48_000730 [Haemaphysalis longicornis]
MSFRRNTAPAYLDSFKLTFTKKLRRFSHQNYQDVTTAVVRCLTCSETNVRYCCAGMRQLLTWSVLEFLPLKICDFLLMHQFTPRASLAGNIRVRNVLVRPLTNLDDLLETKPRDHVETVLPTYVTPPILKSL